MTMDDIIKIRPNTLDWAKFIAMYCVILGHYVYYYNIPFSVNSFDWKIAYFVTLFHMPFFFIISGLLFKPQEDFKLGIKKNIKTLLLPYLLISVIVGLYYYLVVLDFDELNIKDLAKYVLGIICGGDLYGKAHLFPVGPIWFIYSLFLVKIAVLLLHRKYIYIYI